MNDNNFENLEGNEHKAPEILKKMVVSEVDFIRNTMQIVSMFVGESFVAAGKLVQEASDDKK